MELVNKNILIGVTGGIATFKVVEVASRLKKLGANVRVMMTKNATEFVSPRTFQEITKNAVSVEMFGDTANFNVAHIALADFADLILIAPATANFLAKAANGIADDLLTTTILAANSPIMIAPSMNTRMLENPATQNNLKILNERGFKILDSNSGILACGVVGKGRLPEPEEICDEILKFFGRSEKLHGKKIIVTAGGTIEPIDPVRYIGNRSSGKMGFEIAKSAEKFGAEVILISSKNFSETQNIKFVKVETAEQMRAEVLKNFDTADAVIMAAAVADYRVKNVAENKIKKSEQNLTLELVKNPDILKELGKIKKSQVLVGFAAETENLLEYAKKKLVEKNLEMIVANDVTAKNAGFNVSTNTASIIWKNGEVENFPNMQKSELAEKIIERVVKNIKNK